MVLLDNTTTVSSAVFWAQGMTDNTTTASSVVCGMGNGKQTLQERRLRLERRRDDRRRYKSIVFVWDNIGKTDDAARASSVVAGVGEAETTLGRRCLP